MSRFLSRLRDGRLRLFGLVALVGLFATACASGAQQTTLEPEGPAAEKIDNLSDITFVIAGVVFVLVEVGVLFVVWKFRRREDDDVDEVPTQNHGNTKLEVGWTLLPAVILAFLAVATVATVLDLAGEPEDATRIRVVGQQWWWSYDYDIDGDGVHPDDDVTTVGIEAPEEYETDIETANEMVIPAGEPVYLDIESRDVIHSYWIPALNGKMDAVPGRTHHLTLEADEPGTYVGQCTEFCGLSHAYMRMSVIALPPAEYDQWVQDQLAEAAEPESELALEGQEAFSDAVCQLPPGRRSQHRGLQRRHPGVGRGAQPHPLRQPRHLRRQHLRPVGRPRRRRQGRGRRDRRGARHQPARGLAAQSAGREGARRR
ncbi:MAG: cytochrome c oxidase subunit II [Acidimicrobiales bacterium]|nr:cytochrome c oxidase subunit II [Acidimicrobiales bacterium]